MSNFIDDDNIEEYRGGTLQLNNQIQLNSQTESIATNSRPSSSGNELSVDQPAISSGYDFLSPAMSESPAEETTEQNPNTKIIIPQYTVPFSLENAKDYFSHRDGLVQAAIDECNSTLIFPNQDGEVVGSWLLTEIDFWDNEKERLVTLTNKALITVKYDFIALKQMEFRKVNLEQIDTTAIGNIVYPPASLVPLFALMYVTNNWVIKHQNIQPCYPWSPGLAAHTISKSIQDIEVIFEILPIGMERNKSKNHQQNLRPWVIWLDILNNRNMKGVRIMWNKGQPLPFLKKWNPFVKDMPLCTFASHPLYWHKDSSEASKKLYDVENFTDMLVATISSLQHSGNEFCKVVMSPIVISNYVGVTSLIHNKNSLGFFKVRGKFSF